jgi:hypothetical protein
MDDDTNIGRIKHCTSVTVAPSKDASVSLISSIFCYFIMSMYETMKAQAQHLLGKHKVRTKLFRLSNNRYKLNTEGKTHRSIFVYNKKRDERTNMLRTSAPKCME